MVSDSSKSETAEKDLLGINSGLNSGKEINYPLNKSTMYN